MFEAQSKSQPKLVYTYAGHNNSNRDLEVKPISTPKSVVTVAFKDKVKGHEQVEHKTWQNETRMQIVQIQQQLKEQHIDQQKTKEVIERRDSQIPLQQTEKQNDQHIKDLTDRRKFNSPDQLRQPKQIEIGYISTKKGPTDGNVSTKKDITHTIIEKQPSVSDNASDKRHQQNSSISYINEALRKEHTLTNETPRGHTKEMFSSEKLSAVEKVERPTRSFVASNVQHETKQSVLPSSADHHVFSISSKPRQQVLLAHSGSSSTDNITPKQIYTQSSQQTSSQQKYQQQSVHSQQEQQNVLQQQEQNALREQTEEVQNTKLHVTAIKVQSHKPELIQPPPKLHVSSNSDKQTDMKQATAPVSQESNSLALSSSTKATDMKPKSELNENPEDQFFVSLSSSTTPSASNPPKSILKNSTSIDQSDLSPITSPLPIPGLNKENSPNFDFRSLLTGRKDKSSASKSSANKVKGQIKHPFMTKTTSPQPQRKASVDSSQSKSDGGPKEGLVRKKSVTFDNQVLLHLEDEVSTVETVLVDA